MHVAFTWYGMLQDAGLVCCFHVLHGLIICHHGKLLKGYPAKRCSGHSSFIRHFPAYVS